MFAAAAAGAGRVEGVRRVSGECMYTHVYAGVCMSVCEREREMRVHTYGGRKTVRSMVNGQGDGGGPGTNPTKALEVHNR